MNSAARNQPPDLRDLLAFYAEAGAYDPLVEEPGNRFEENKRPTVEAAPHPYPLPVKNGERESPTLMPPSPRFSRGEGKGEGQAPTSPKAAVPDGAQAALARELAANSATLDELSEHMARFEGCNLKFTAKNTVFADGNPDAAVMLVGEAPGRDEDVEGLPFVGRSGQLLDRMLAAIGLDRTSVYIANVIPWRPPGNRTPTPHETEICRPFIERQIELAGPKLLITLGGPSAKLLLNTVDGILRLRGNWRSHVTASGVSIPTMPTLHPAYLLRNPAHKKLAWRDFLEVKAKLRQLG
ncbi:uracil-DNA glycosylase [Allomesorhizobium camelthorni]|uniref:Type-4 uracil-DNA glycosylase n=1 Tax=Allomesorhizobium camelthorni TaxID=475069 RepID=A0A6G4WJF6_9HYPH|nr:uracil-DNA glycosylase [Mesorhizobium camelthorni]NGO54356.1 uracil-DNA glycosylase [Mesorhizobium camelthorni]